VNVVVVTTLNKINRKVVFEEHFVSYDRLKYEWEWESPSLVFL
jgi:hypothetical protein